MDTLNRTIEVLMTLPRGNPVVIRDEQDVPMAVMYRFQDDPNRVTSTTHAGNLTRQHPRKPTRKERLENAEAKRRRSKMRVAAEKRHRTRQHEANRMRKIQRRPSNRVFFQGRYPAQGQSSLANVRFR